MVSDLAQVSRTPMIETKIQNTTAFLDPYPEYQAGITKWSIR